MFNRNRILSLTSWDTYDECLEAESNIVFVLTGTMHDLPERVFTLQQKGKKVFLHVDFVTGIQSQTFEGMSYIAEEIAPDGVISTKAKSIQHAKKLNLITIQRIFLIDTHALNKAIEMCLKTRPDAIEVMPGLMPRVISEIVERVPFPIVAGGMFKTNEEIKQAFQAGASAVSGSRINLFGY